MPLWTSFTVKEGFPGTVGAPWTADVRLASAAASSCPELQEFADQGFAAEPLFPPGEGVDGGREGRREGRIGRGKG